MIKAIVFDIGGVVTETDFGAVWVHFSKRIGIDPKIVEEYHEKNIVELLLGNISLESFWQEIRDEIQKTGSDMIYSDNDLKKIWIEEGVQHRKVNHGLLDIIKKLREKYTVGVLTNVSAGRQLMDDEMKLYDHFDFSILSCIEHKRKPHAEFFNLIFDKVDAKPEEIIFVDDQKRMTDAADALGMHSYVFTYPENLDFIGALREKGVMI